MMNKRLTQLVVGLCALGCTGTVQAKDVVDTLTSSDGDQVILSYTISQSGGKTTVLFTNVQKKLGSANQRKYRKLNEVAVAIFDRTGTYNDTKFEGMTPAAFMIPAGVSYTPSEDGFFLLGDNPQLTFNTSSEAQISIPVYIAHYEKKRHYKLFSKCSKDLVFSTKVTGGGGGRPPRGGGGSGTRAGDDRAANADDIIIEGEVDEGLTPTQDAQITIANVSNQLESVSKVPFPDDLTRQINHLSDLRTKVSDLDVRQEIDDILFKCDKKKTELEEKAAVDKKAEEEAAKRAADSIANKQKQEQDSIQAAEKKEASEEKKGMMWMIGGIAGVGMLLMFGKQIFQTIKNNKMQRMMMDNLNKAQQQAMGHINIPGMENNPLGQEVNQMLKKEANKKMTAEGNAAKEKLAALTKGGGGKAAAPTAPPASPTTPAAPAAPAAPAGTAAPAAPATPGKRPLRKASEVRAAAGMNSAQNAGLDITVKPQKQSMNDVIPAKYKRWRKPGTPDSNK